MEWLKKWLFKKELQELNDLRGESALFKNRVSTLESEISNIQKAYGKMQDLSHQIEDEQNRLEKAFVETLNGNEKDAYLKGVKEIQKKSQAGKITGTLTSSAIIGLGLFGKSAAVITATLATIGGSMVGGVALILALPLMGGLLDRVKDFFTSILGEKKISLEKIMEKKAQYFKEHQDDFLELATNLEEASTEFEELMMKEYPKQITHK